MKQISIELITKGEPTTEKVLESISQQTFGDYEVTCVNSSYNPMVAELLKEYGVHEIPVKPHTKHLEARYLAHTNSTGEFRLLLDSTRPLDKNTLETLLYKYSKFRAVCIREKSLGQGFWVKQADILRSLSEHSDFQKNGSKIAYLLPRFYRGDVLNNAFKFLKQSIDNRLFTEISYGEHHLIYDAAKLEPSDITITDEALISHYEDESSKAIFRKYHWYGKSQRTLNLLKFDSNVNKLNSHKRPFSFSTFVPKMRTIPIRSLRTIAFLIGYFF